MGTKITFSILLLLCGCLLFAQKGVQFNEKTFWKGDISIQPHSLYRGCGLASNGSFFLGDSGNLFKINLPSGTKDVIVKTTNPDQYA